MKIAFLTSCLEPGCDGVGDYTTLLAGECERLGHDVRLLALNDPHAGSPGSDAGPLRLAPSLSWPERVERDRKFLNAFEPDFVSLQFVCYGFHPRGIDFALDSRLREITGPRPVHIMFHELWIGAEKGASLKDRFLGGLQRSSLLGIVRALDVRAVHASNSAYVAMLGEWKIGASLLPIFGSIPIPGRGASARKEDGSVAFGLFGALHPVWPPEPLFSLLLKSCKKITVAHIGGIGGGAKLWKKLERDYADLIVFKEHGRQPPERIAEFFRSETDFGIATTPWELIGKSAAVAAMLEHGLPVIVNRDDWHTANGAAAAPVSPLLIKMDESLPGKLFTVKRAKPQSLLPGVAAQFLGDLERAL